MLNLTTTRYRRGLTLIEAALVLGVTALVFAGFASVLSDQAENNKSKAVADRLQEVAAASTNYIIANKNALTTLTAAGPVLIPVARPTPGGMVPPGPGNLPSVQSGGFLPSSFVDSNAYGQTHVLVVRQSGSGTAAHLEGMLFTDAGILIPDRQVGRVARFEGAQGGFMMQSPGANQSAGVIYGVAGGWQSAASLWNAGGAYPKPGHVMAILSSIDNPTDLTGQFLNRTNTGDAEANTMRTDLHLGNNNIDGVTNIAGATNELQIGPNIRVPGYVNAGGDVTSGGNVSAAGTVKAGGTVTGSSFVDGADPNWYVTPHGTSVLNDVHAVSAEIGNGQSQLGTYQDPNSKAAVTVDGSLSASSFDVDTLIYGNSVGYGAQGIRLGDLLPHYVALGQYFWTATDNVVPKPACATGIAGVPGIPKIQLALLSDSQSFQTVVNSNTMLGDSYLGATQTIDTGYNATVFSETPLVTDVSGGTTTTARKIAAVDQGDGTWAIRVSGSNVGPSNYPETGTASTFCLYPY